MVIDHWKSVATLEACSPDVPCHKFKVTLDDIADVSAWLAQNATGVYSVFAWTSFAIITIVEDRDAMLFKLSW